MHLRQTYGGYVEVVYMKAVVNWLSLCLRKPVWCPLHEGSLDIKHVLFCRVSTLKNAPAPVVVCPPEKLEVAKRIETTKE